MERSLSPEADRDRLVTQAESELLLDLADGAIVAGLRGQVPATADLAGLPAAVRRPAGAFVTLSVRGELNGCIGSIEGTRPLAHAVVAHGWSAAFADPRLPALRWSDYDELDIEISILSPTVSIPARSRADLIDRLRPGIDGLVIGVGGRRAVFLPSVWDAIADPEDFLDRLYLKAGLPPGSWLPGMWADRFTADKFGRRAVHEP